MPKSCGTMKEGETGRGTMKALDRAEPLLHSKGEGAVPDSDVDAKDTVRKVCR